MLSHTVNFPSPIIFLNYIINYLNKNIKGIMPFLM